MKHSEAIYHLRSMLWTIQRFRSISKEEMGKHGWPPQTVQNVLSDLFPWMHSNKCPLNVLSVVLDRADNGETIEPLFFYNMVTIATHLEDSMLFMIQFFGQNDNFPKQPDIQWLKGWEAES